MSAALYARAARVALAKIRQYGRTAQLVRRGDLQTGSDEPHRPNRDEPAEHDVYILQTDNSITHEPDTVIQQNDLFGLLAAPTTGEQPDDTRDRLKDGDRTYEFVRVKPLAPGNGVVLYEFHARI